MIKTSYPRLRSVRYKDGGGQLVVLPKAENPCHTEIVKFAKQVADTVENEWEDLHGFLVVFWDRTGDYRAGWRYSPLTEGQPVPATLVPAFVHDILLRERVGKMIAEVTDFLPEQGDP